LLPLLPFLLYVFVFLGLPALAVVFGAFRDGEGGWTLANVRTASSGLYRHSFAVSIKMSIISAVIPAILGVILAYVIRTSGNRTLIRITSTVSAVFANFGGVPLAFAFIATLGNTGLVTRLSGALGFPIYDHGYSLFTFSGVVLVYAYFQIPLMVIVITPALGGLRPAWREATENLGGGAWAYWRYVGGPALAPPFLGAVLLLFGSAFSAYATTYALLGSTLPLVPIQIGALLSGNVQAGQENVGQALGAGMLLVIAVVMVLYAVLQRRASRWLR
jgi:putative spermidine/putrescine transport system permease protein